MNKKIGFWQWFFLLPMRIFKWIFGIGKKGKENLKGNDIIERYGTLAIIYELCAGFFLFFWFSFGNSINTSSAVPFSLLVMFGPTFLIFGSAIIYDTYLEETKK